MTSKSCCSGKIQSKKKVKPVWKMRNEGGKRRSRPVAAGS